MAAGCGATGREAGVVVVECSCAFEGADEEARGPVLDAAGDDPYDSVRA
jgi:hypothetical protein